MFVVSEKFDKEMRSNYATLVEETSNAIPHRESNNAYEFAENRFNKPKNNKCVCLAKSILVCVCFIVVTFFIYRLLPGQNGASHTEIFVDPSPQAYQIAITTIKDSRVLVRAVSQQNLLVRQRNKQEATAYLDRVQELLKKRVKYSVSRISRLIQGGVQEIENEIALFERSFSTMLNGVLDVTKHSVGDIKDYVQKVSAAKDISELQKTIEQVQNETTQLLRNLDEMFNYQGTHLNDIIHDKIQSITDRIQKILVADRKRFQNVVGLQMAFCYNISRQNCDISTHLEKILKAMNKLRKTGDSVNVLSSTFAKVGESPLIVKAKYALSRELNNTKEIFHSIMNTDDNFLSTTLKQLAYQKHIEMRDFVYKNYETVIRSTLPAVGKVTQGFKIVKDSHWKQVTKDVYPLLTDLSTLIQTKAALITDNNDGVHPIEPDSVFKTTYSLLENRFQEIATKVNSFFRSKQDYEGFELMLEASMDEKLPLISTWSLRNYVPSDACPITVEFQTYLKGVMDQYLSRSDSLQVIPSVEI